MTIKLAKAYNHAPNNIESCLTKSDDPDQVRSDI